MSRFLADPKSKTYLKIVIYDATVHRGESLRVCRPYSHSDRPITLRSLAMQCSGLPRSEPSYNSSLSAAAQQEEVLSKLHDVRAMSYPFAATSYSNLGLALLGRALEVVSGSDERMLLAPPNQFSQLCAEHALTVLPNERWRASLGRRSFSRRSWHLSACTTVVRCIDPPRPSLPLH